MVEKPRNYPLFCCLLFPCIISVFIYFYYIYFFFLVRSGKRNLIIPKTITCRVISNEMLKALAYTAVHEDNIIERGQNHANFDVNLQQSSCNTDNEASLVLAGLHACGDLSVMMLK